MMRKNFILIGYCSLSLTAWKGCKDKIPNPKKEPAKPTTEMEKMFSGLSMGGGIPSTANRSIATPDGSGGSGSGSAGSSDGGNVDKMHRPVAPPQANGGIGDVKDVENQLKDLGANVQQNADGSISYEVPVPGGGNASGQTKDILGGIATNIIVPNPNDELIEVRIIARKLPPEQEAKARQLMQGGGPSAIDGPNRRAIEGSSSNKGSSSNTRAIAPTPTKPPEEPLLAITNG